MALQEVPPLARVILLSSLMISLFIALCLDKIKLLEFYKMISNPKIFFFSFMLQRKGDIFHSKDPDPKRYGISANLMAEPYKHHVLVTQIVISPGSQMLLCAEHFWIHLLIPKIFFFFFFT